MKKLVFVLVIVLCAINILCAQTTEILTNSTIVMMVKAKLSDDLIIDEIHSSKVNFNLSNDSIKFLSSENVSAQVIQIMKTASGLQTSTSTDEIIKPANPVEPDSLLKKKESTQHATIQSADTLKQPEHKQVILTEKDASLQASAQVTNSVTQPVKNQSESQTETSKELSKENIQTERGKNNLNEKSTLTFTAFNYTIPIEDLTTFFDNEFNSMAAIIKGFDERIRDSIERVNTIKEKMLQVEKEITEKKNADNKEYSNEIILLKKSLVDYRKKYELVKKNMFTDGINITKELKNIIDEKEQSINNKFDDVCKKIRAKNTDPSKGEIAKSIAITKQKFNTDIVNYVAPVTEILNFYENEIVSLHDVVVLWSGKVVATIQKDSVLSKQLEPLNKELTGYNSDPKKNKKEIAELKKQCSKIEKERKELANQMEDDCKELSGYLKQQCKEIFSALNVRFVDIIENINYSYQDKF